MAAILLVQMADGPLVSGLGAIETSSLSGRLEFSRRFQTATCHNSRF